MRVTQHQPRTRPDTTDGGRARFGIERTATRKGTVVRVLGELDAASAPQLETALAVEAHEHRHVLLDLSRTTFIDSAGIRVLVRSMWDLRDEGASLRLVAASTMAENILRITGILDVLKEQAP